MKPIAVIAYAFITAGCVGSVHYTNNPNYPANGTKITRTYVDPLLPQEGILLAVKEWNQAMNGSYSLLVMKWEEDPQPPAVVIRSAHHDTTMLRIAGPEAIAATHAWTGSYPSALIYADIDWLSQYPYMTVSTIEHELGHAFGAEHMDGTLMQWNLNSSHCIDEKTIVQVANKLHLDPQYLNHC